MGRCPGETGGTEAKAHSSRQNGVTTGLIIQRRAWAEQSETLSTEQDNGRCNLQEQPWSGEERPLF